MPEVGGVRTDVYERRLLEAVKALPYSGAITMLAEARREGGIPVVPRECRLLPGGRRQSPFSWERRRA